MSTYHCSVKHGSHGTGASAGAKAAYICREGKYADKPDLAYSASGNMPEWAQENPRAFWQAADNYERANGRLYTEIEIALPREISAEQRENLVNGFAYSELNGLPYTVAIHNPRAGIEGGEQPHAHIVFSERKQDGIERDEEQFFKRANTKAPEKGGCAKDRTWNDQDKVQQIRESWEQHYNRFSQPQVSCRSLEAQGIDREPERHMGPSKSKARSPEVVQIIERRRHLKELREINQEMRSLSKDIEAAKAAQVAAERAAVEKAAQVAAERAVAEKTAQVAAERAAVEKAAQVAAERVAAEKAAQVVAERVAVEKAAQAKRVESLPSKPVEAVKPAAPAIERPAPVKPVESPAFDPAAGRKRVTEVDNAINQIEQQYAPTAAQVEADNKSRYPELEASRQADRNAKIKGQHYNAEVETWKGEGAKNRWDSDNDSLFRSPAQRAWQKDGEELRHRQTALIEEKRQAAYNLERIEQHVRMYGGAELRKEAAAQRDKDPEYQKLKVERSAITAALREDKKEKEKVREKEREPEGRNR